MGSPIRERLAKALCNDILSRWRSPIALYRDPWNEFLPAADAILALMADWLCPKCQCQTNGSDGVVSCPNCGWSEEDD